MARDYPVVFLDVILFSVLTVVTFLIMDIVYVMVDREFRTELDKPNSLNDLEAWCAELRKDGQYFLQWQTTQEWDGDIYTIFHSRRGSGTANGYDLNSSSYWSFCFLALCDRTKVFTKN